MDYTTGKLNATRFDFIEVNRYNKQTDLDNGVGGEPVERRYFDRAFQDPGTPVGSAQVSSCIPGSPQSVHHESQLEFAFEHVR